jgi:hypothetical protein
MRSVPAEIPVFDPRALSIPGIRPAPPSPIQVPGRPSASAQSASPPSAVTASPQTEEGKP